MLGGWIELGKCWKTSSTTVSCGFESGWGGLEVVCVASWVVLVMLWMSVGVGRWMGEEDRRGLWGGNGGDKDLREGSWG